VELSSEALSAALTNQQLEFTEAEWEEFDVIEELERDGTARYLPHHEVQRHHFIECNGSYYQPAGALAVS
jgi:hypothetical protein